MRTEFPARRVRVCFALAATAFLGFATAALSARAQAPGDEWKTMLGDAPDDPGPLARMSPSLRPAAVKAAMAKVASWQLARVNGKYSQDWTTATLYLGFVHASATLYDRRYAEYVKRVGEHYGWALGPRRTHADDQAIGQSYLWLYGADEDKAKIAPLQKQFDEIMIEPDDPQKPVWWWCDALFMAPPVWAGLAQATGDAKYIAYMDREWHITADLLWDNENHLFFRDSSYFDKREANGAKIFWSRGNGWVLAGLARVLSLLPENDPRRAFYVEKFRAMAAELRSLQGEDGLWRPGLLDAAHYPYPEISGSSFYVYGMAWGVRHGLLDRAMYMPVIERGWRGLVAHIYENGRLGSIQPIGAAPDAYTPSASYDFGVGAFLMAGSEVAELGGAAKTASGHDRRHKQR